MKEVQSRNARNMLSGCIKVSRFPFNISYFFLSFTYFAGYIYRLFTLGRLPAVLGWRYCLLIPGMVYKTGKTAINECRKLTVPIHFPFSKKWNNISNLFYNIKNCFLIFVIVFKDLEGSRKKKKQFCSLSTLLN